MSSKLGYLDMDAPGQRKADQQSTKLTLGQGGATRRVVLHPGALHSLLQNEPDAEHRERVCSCSVRLHCVRTGLVPGRPVCVTTQDNLSHALHKTCC